MSPRFPLAVVAGLFAAACGRVQSQVPADAEADGFKFFPWGRYDGGGEIPQCGYTARTLEVEPRLSDVLIVFDRSGSMSNAFGTGTRYSVEAELLTDMVVTYQD